jgi:hypothetical protein
MNRNRSHWKIRVMQTTTRSSAPGHPAVTVTTHGNTEFQTLTDATSSPYPPRATEKISYSHFGRTKVVTPAYAPVNYAYFTSRNRFEPIGQNVLKDHSGAHALTTKGHCTQFLTAFQPGGVMPGGEITGDPPGYNLAGMILICKAKAISNFDKPTLPFGEPVAELRQTLRLISSPMAAISSTLTAFQKKARLKDWRTQRQRAKGMAKMWASYSFGIAPLWRFVDESVDLFRNKMDTLVSEISRHSETIVFEGALQTSSGSFTLTPIVGTWRRTRKLKVTVRCGIHAIIDDANSFRTKVGSRARDLPVTLWEVFPLSFMIDRVVDVKSALSTALSLSSLNVRILGGWQTIRTLDERSYRYTGCSVSGAGNSFTPGDTLPFRDDLYVFERIPWKPQLSDIYGPRLGRGLLSNLSKTLDLMSVCLIKLT